MEDRSVRLLVIDDHDELDKYYQEILADVGNFSTRTASNGTEACQLITTFEPEILVADIDKFADMQRIVAAAQGAGTVLIWASSFKTVDFEDLPVKARIVNKPFRAVDLKMAIRSELNKARKAAYIRL